jgi:hypothetical protein
MPKKNIDYSKTIIYKIVCKDLSIKDVYIGSTTNYTKRKCNHKCYCNSNKYKYKDRLIYKVINDNGGWENWEMIEIEKYPCVDGNESTKRERHYYELLNATMNKCIPNRLLNDEEREKLNKELLSRKEKYNNRMQVLL